MRIAISLLSCTLATTAMAQEPLPPQAFETQDSVSYDEVGYAASDLTGSQAGVSAIVAKNSTLTDGSFVEVTALDSGRTVLVRIIGRDENRLDRILTLSGAASDQLGLNGRDAFPVRVRLVNPIDQEKAVLRSNGEAAPRLETPEYLLVVLRKKLQPLPSMAKNRTITPVDIPPSVGAELKNGDVISPIKPTARIAPGVHPNAASVAGPAPQSASLPSVPLRGGYVVQLGAFSSKANAERLAHSHNASVSERSGLWRVRKGPYASRLDAQAAMKEVIAKGIEKATILSNDVP